MLEKGGPESSWTRVLVKREMGRERADEGKGPMRRSPRGPEGRDWGDVSISQGKPRLPHTPPAGRHRGPRASCRSATLLTPGFFMLLNCGV